MLSVWRKSKTRGKAGIALTVDGVAHAELLIDKQEVCLQSCGYQPAEQANVLSLLSGLHKDETLSDCQLSICLESSRFNLSLIETPAVDQSELQQALIWKVKELIDYPLNELILDYVDVPVTRSGNEMVYTVTARESSIQEILDYIRPNTWKLERIDIPALALQNVLSRMPHSEEGIALLNLTRRDSLLTLGRGDKLYLSRSVDIHSTELTSLQIGQDGHIDSSLLDNLLLDIQRSLDYYDSFFVDPPIRRLLVSNPDHASDALIEYLGENLAIEVKGFTLEDIASTTEDLVIDQEHYGELVLAVGAALCPAGLVS